jgi:hypothetical protein
MRLLPAIIHFTKLLLGAICSLLIGLLILGVLVFIFGMLQNSFWEKELTLKPMRESGSLSDLSTSFVDMSRSPFEIWLLHALLIVRHLPENDLWPCLRIEAPIRSHISQHDRWPDRSEEQLPSLTQDPRFGS